MPEQLHGKCYATCGNGHLARSVWERFISTINSKSEAAKGYLRGGLPGAVAGALDYDTIAKQAEDSGYLPAQNYQNRKLLLSIPDGAIRYIGGIMAAIADSAGRYGFRDIRSDPEILTNVDQSMDLRKWQEHLSKKPKGSDFSGGNEMDIWVKANLNFLIAAVGEADIPESQPVGPAPQSTGGAAEILEVLERYTLSDIAHSEYGSWELWPLIYDQNKSTIGPNPNRLKIGLRLTIPPLSRYTAAQVADAKRRAPSWKTFK